MAVVPEPIYVVTGKVVVPEEGCVWQTSVGYQDEVGVV